MENEKIILCGSGNSIPFLNRRYYGNGFKDGIDGKLINIIQKNYSFGLNHFYRYGCETTANLSGDHQFYHQHNKELKHVPFIIAVKDPKLGTGQDVEIHKNTILLPMSGDYFGKDSLKKGIYTKYLIGIWALTLSIALGFKEIYLLGYDSCAINGQTHFYQGVVDINIKGTHSGVEPIFRGVGMVDKDRYKTSPYNDPNALNNQWFSPFKNEKNIGIFNVSQESAINVFPKISYDEFYERIGENSIKQTEARDKIRMIIKNAV